MNTTTESDQQRETREFNTALDRLDASIAKLRDTIDGMDLEMTTHV